MRVEVLKAPVSSSQGRFSLYHHHQHPLIQCDISHSPANCAVLTGSKYHIHTQTHTTYRDPAIPSALLVCSGQLCLCPFFGPCSRGDIAKEGQRADLLNEASWWLRGVCACECKCECMCACLPAGGLVWNDLPFYHHLPCVYHSFFHLQPFSSRCLSKSQCF